MKKTIVNLGIRSYPIITGQNILADIGKYVERLNIGKDVYLITNRTVAKYYAKTVVKSLKQSGYSCRQVLVADTEESKSLSVICGLLKDLACFDKQKHTFIAALGGGVVGDIAGFVAAVYRRGVPYIQIPTTLLAQVDSSIGGKTGVDLAEGKNLVGAFYQPKLVFCDTAVLKTLSLRQVRTGFAEIVKYALIDNPAFFDYLEANSHKLLDLNDSVLEHAVSVCANIKARIVSEDETEAKSMRTLLNFGHTIGHAIEAATAYKVYTHGEALSLGMVAAVQISAYMRLLPAGSVERVTRLLEDSGLPVVDRGLSIPKVLSCHYHDKKFKGKTNRFVLLKNIGQPVILKNIPLIVIQDVLKRLLGRGISG